MLQDNIKNLRKNKGLTQEELAIQLHVVRQTVSKWEKGLSVPDAQMLQKLADVLDTEVRVLLGSPVAASGEPDPIAEQLAKISEQLAVRNRRWHTFWKVLGIVVLALLLLNLSFAAAGLITFSTAKTEITTSVSQPAPMEP